MKNQGTEDTIRRAAKKLFFMQGKLHARMQEIADEAGVNRALLHYYYRNRQQLFESVLREALEDSFMSMFTILSAPGAFEKKVTSAVYHIIDMLSEYPYIESFIVSELNSPVSGTLLQPVVERARSFTAAFKKETAIYLKKRKHSFVSPENFIVNMMALCVYPASTGPLIRGILGQDQKKHSSFLKKRRKMVARLVLMKY